ncbi:glutathione S-transferase [Haematococcus lacustris]
MAPKIIMHYFDLPGRAETTRLLLKMGGIEYEEKIIERETWPDVKKTMPFGQVPVLEVDGKLLAQSSAMERYAAGLAHLLPTDLWALAKHDELLGFLNEIGDLLMATYSIQDPEAKIKARQDLVAGPIKAKLEKLSSMLEAAGGKFFLGETALYVDIAIFKSLSGLTGGTMDGVPTTLLDDYPVLKAFHSRVAALPPIKAFYEAVTEGPRLAYKPRV